MTGWSEVWREIFLWSNFGLLTPRSLRMFLTAYLSERSVWSYDNYIVCNNGRDTFPISRWRFHLKMRQSSLAKWRKCHLYCYVQYLLSQTLMQRLGLVLQITTKQWRTGVNFEKNFQKMSLWRDVTTSCLTKYPSPSTLLTYNQHWLEGPGSPGSLISILHNLIISLSNFIVTVVVTYC